MSMLSMLRPRPVFVLFAGLLCWTGGDIPSARADAVGAQQISNAVSMATKEEIQSQEAFNQSLIESLDSLARDIKANRILIEDKVRERDATVSTSKRLSDSLAAGVVGIAGTENTVKDILQLRLNELNLVRSNTSEALAPYLVDPTKDILNTNAQIFEIFMRFFCDPEGRNGEFRNARIRTQRYTLGCGAVWTTENDANNNPIAVIDSNVDSRDDVFGLNPTGENKRMRDQLINLPLRPEAMFFNAETFPVGDAPGHTNTNTLAPLYYAAFAQAMHFMIGPPPPVPNVAELELPGGQDRYNKTQATITRQMLATYPFALLFGERVGLMGEEAAQQISSLLLERFGNAAADPILFDRVQNIGARRNISKAEYMDILMYQMMLSPGYLHYIEDLTPSQASREVVWLTALQTAVNYERNRWLEIQAALEAVRQD